MPILYINLLFLSVIFSSALAVLAFSDCKTNFSIPAIHKNSGPILRKRVTGTVTASLTDIDTYNEYTYTCPVIIGGQTVNLQFDTASNLPWAFSINMPPEMRENHHFFDPSLSSTYRDIGIDFSITYADGDSAAGNLGSDTMDVGGISLQNQAFGVANTVSENFVTGYPDGILGLSLSRTLPDSTLPSFIGNASEVLSAPLFAAYLPYKVDGAFDFGAINTNRYTGSLLSTTISNSQTFWKVDSTAYKVGSVDYNSSGVSAIIDSATDFIYLQSSQVTTYYTAVPNSYYSDEYKGWVYPCSQTLPSISLLIGPINYATIPGANLVTGFRDEGGILCYGGIQYEPSQNSVNTYGLLFFSAYYCIFDFATPRFAFGNIVVPTS